MTAFFSVVQVAADNKYEWRLYGGNNRLVLKSPRTYNSAAHARAAVHRLQYIVSNASFTYGVGYKKPSRAKSRTYRLLTNL